MSEIRNMAKMQIYKVV